jgi:hypothetical protein
MSFPEEADEFLDPVVARLSEFPDLWNQALSSDDALLDELVRCEPPGVTIFQIGGAINGFYRGEQRGWVKDRRERIEKLRPYLALSRRRLGWRQREVDIPLMRWIRRGGLLSPVIGAGVSQAAGAPGWADLVKVLVRLALERGHEITQMVPSPDNPPEPFEPTADGGLRYVGNSGGISRYTREVIRVERFSPDSEAQAREILATLQSGPVTDTELLMRGAQLCSDLLGQEMFTYVTGLLYQNAPGPGEIHRAIASIAQPQEVYGGRIAPGWESVITYNFDDLMGEAFAEFNIPHGRWALTRRGIRIDPDRRAQQTYNKGDPNFWYIPIYHLHGYTPRRPFLITDIRFVFSIAQYQTIYSQSKELLDRVLQDHLANPVHVALYIGCSFTDQAMNGLLFRAAEQWPGRWHYAILKWPEKRHGRVPDGDEIQKHSARYLALGIQPIWIDDYSEIPDLIRSLL